MIEKMVGLKRYERDNKKINKRETKKININVI